MNHCKDDETGDEVYWTVKEGTPIYDGDTGDVFGYLGEPTSVKINAENKITEIAAGEFAVAQDPAEEERVTRYPWSNVASEVNQIGKHMEEGIKESIRQEAKAPKTFWREAECASRTHVDSPTIGALKNAAKWADRRYSKPGTRSIHNKGEAIMDPYWAKPTLDERLTVSADPEESEYDIISRPSHYEAGRKYAPKDVIRDWGLNYNLGSAVKYLARAGRKDAIINDLEKARTFIQFEIEALAEEGEEEES